MTAERRDVQREQAEVLADLFREHEAEPEGPWTVYTLPQAVFLYVTDLSAARQPHQRVIVAIMRDTGEISIRPLLDKFMQREKVEAFAERLRNVVKRAGLGEWLV
jgi:hypothetical protein